MNRQQRRKLAKRGITHKDLKYIQQKTQQNTIKQAVDFYSVAVAMVLRDKWGFGEKRLQRFMTQVQDMFDSINKGYVSFEDCKKVLYKETGIKFE